MTEQQQRPSDEVTAGVVAKQHSLAGDDPLTYGSGLFHYDYYNDVYADPRNDTDAALELLWSVMDSEQMSHIGGECMQPFLQGKWSLGSDVYREWKQYTTIPASGQPFRYAVVHLAAKVLGVE